MSYISYLETLQNVSAHLEKENSAGFGDHMNITVKDASTHTARVHIGFYYLRETHNLKERSISHSGQSHEKFIHKH